MKLEFRSLFPALCKNLQVTFKIVSDLKCFIHWAKQEPKKKIKNRHLFPQQQVKP